VRNLTLTQTYAGPLLSGFTQTWSLCTEVAFYVLLPFFAPVLATWSTTPAGRRRCAAGLLGACLVAWTWAALATTSLLPPLAGTWLPGHLDWFAVGVALALAEAHAQNRRNGPVQRLLADWSAHPGTLLLLAGALFWLAGTPLAGPRLLTSTTPIAAVIKEGLYAGVAGLVLAAVALVDQRRGPTAAALGNPSAQHLGRVSYGIFLWHLLVLAAVMNLLDRRIFAGGFWIVLVPTVVGTVLVASVSWLLLESRVLRWAHGSPRVTPAGDDVAAASRPTVTS
jgi:peptidoglycan/LPS O-acetylase OafA/YrhL